MNALRLITIGTPADGVNQLQAFVASRGVVIALQVGEDEIHRWPIEFGEELFWGGGHAGAIAAVFEQKVQGDEDIGLVITTKSPRRF